MFSKRENPVILVCLGAGGVGKTTTAAALALRAALQGKRTLCLTIDPARRLANSVGLTQFSTEKQWIDLRPFVSSSVEDPLGKLAIMMVDAEKVFDGIVTSYAPNEKVRDQILENRFYRMIASSLAGTLEYMAMETLYAEFQTGDWDCIVLDTPPTANAMDFFSAPSRLVDAIDSPATQWLQKSLERSGTFSLSLLEHGARFVIQGLATFTGLSFLEKLAELIQHLNGLFGGFRQRARSVQSLLTESCTHYFVVSTPRSDAISEALHLQSRLQELKQQLSGFVINRVMESPATGPLTSNVSAPDSLRTALEKAWEDERLSLELQEKAILALSGTNVPTWRVIQRNHDIKDPTVLRSISEQLNIPHLTVDSRL